MARFRHLYSGTCCHDNGPAEGRDQGAESGVGDHSNAAANAAANALLALVGVAMARMGVAHTGVALTFMGVVHVGVVLVIVGVGLAVVGVALALGALSRIPREWTRRAQTPAALRRYFRGVRFSRVGNVTQVQ